MSKRKNKQLANRLMCLWRGHDYDYVQGTRNMFVCKRCGEPGWMA